MGGEVGDSGNLGGREGLFSQKFSFWGSQTHYTHQDKTKKIISIDFYDFISLFTP